jgi:predicted ATP-dependent serine protease
MKVSNCCGASVITEDDKTGLCTACKEWCAVEEIQELVDDMKKRAAIRANKQITEEDQAGEDRAVYEERMESRYLDQLDHLGNSFGRYE